MNNDIAKCSLAELVEDPLIRLVMKSDGVDRRTVELLFQRVARERARGVHELRRHRKEEATWCRTC
jgi:hypothetical protein